MDEAHPTRLSSARVWVFSLPAKRQGERSHLAENGTPRVPQLALAARPVAPREEGLQGGLNRSHVFLLKEKDGGITGKVQ